VRSRFNKRREKGRYEEKVRSGLGCQEGANIVKKETLR